MFDFLLVDNISLNLIRPVRALLPAPPRPPRRFESDLTPLAEERGGVREGDKEAGKDDTKKEEEDRARKKEREKEKENEQRRKNWRKAVSVKLAKPLVIGKGETNCGSGADLISFLLDRI